jgi:hypothetical protein
MRTDSARTTHVRVGLLASLFVAVATSAAAQQALPEGHVTPLEQIDKAGFERLPDDAQVEVKGRRLTKREYLAETESTAQHREERLAERLRARIPEQIERQRVRFVEEERAQLAARNAEVEAALTAWLQSHAAELVKATRMAPLQEEIAQLYRRYAEAGPEERERLTERAEELARLLEDVPR